MDESIEGFRAGIRTWLEQNCPPSMRLPMGQDEVPWEGRFIETLHPDAKLWRERLASRGLVAPGWPKAYGGAELSKDEQEVLKGELRRIHARPAVVGGGIPMFGSVFLDYGSEELRERFLPLIARGQIRWATGFSEPGRGSDLAGLQTRATREGDHYLVHGQKIWTSYADVADWLFCAVRTDPNARKHEGITILLIPIDAPGMKTTRIDMISGTSHFCQVFLDGVRVPVGNRLGAEGQGWQLIRRALENEREWVAEFLADGSSIFGLAESRPLPEMAREYEGSDQAGRIRDEGIRQAVAQCELDSLCYELLSSRLEQSVTGGRVSGFATSVVKYLGAALTQKKYELMTTIHGSQGVGWEGEGFSEDELRMTRAWLRSKANSIESGTSEIQLNVIAKRILGLPESGTRS